VSGKERFPVTYCTNIHPGESWAATLQNLETHTLAVKAAVCPTNPFPVGLRISGQASREIDCREAERFKAWLGSHGLFVTTLNGFPYGTFHGSPVKAQVYQPDWRSPVRLEYTLQLAELLSLWLPEGLDGSISSVPVGFKAGFDPSQSELARQNLVRALQGLDALAQRTGKRIQLSLEPEPGCLLETTSELVDFFASLSMPDFLRGHLGICYDCCHQALQFENPAQSLKLLEDNSISIGHVQVSSALHLPCSDLSCLSRFDEPVYLHQCVALLSDGGLERFDDLGQALGTTRDVRKKIPGACLEDTECWRVHFHLPVFLAELPECLTTQEFLIQFLPMLPADVPLEVETYTFSILPRELQTATVVESIVREIEWVESCRSGVL
jgi:sugar phosphate isomerase/epimerase